MDELIESIRAAIAPNASDEARAAGVTACATVLKTLGVSAEPTTPATPRLPIEMIATALRGMPAEQLLDMAIARLRALVPNAETAPRQGFKFQRVPLPEGVR